MFHKLTPELHYSVLPHMASHPTFAQALQYIQFHDNELRLAQAKTPTSRARPPAKAVIRPPTPFVLSSGTPREKSFTPRPNYSSPAPPVLPRVARLRSPAPAETTLAPCFSCGQAGYFKSECPQLAIYVVEEQLSDEEPSDESENEQP